MLVIFTGGGRESIELWLGPVKNLALHAVLPASTSLWWYPTHYIIFLLLYPWLLAGLRSLSRRMHRNLVLLLIASAGVLPTIPEAMRYSFILFLYVFVILTYVRWHLPEVVASRRVGGVLLAGGVTGGVVSVVTLSIVLPSHAGAYLDNPFLFPSVSTGLGLLIIATQWTGLHSVFVNQVASSTLAVYLILTYPGLAGMLMGSVYTGDPVAEFGNPYVALVAQVGIAAAFFGAVLAIDQVRKFAFSLTIDRPGRTGALFERAWNRVETSHAGRWLAS